MIKTKVLTAVLIYLFVMMTISVKADGVFDLKRESIAEFFEQSTRGFTDTGGHWAEQEIYQAVDLGYVTGTTPTTFSPDLPMTRAMLVTLLYRMAGQPDIPGKSNYKDVQPGSWYEKAVLWTVDRGIAYGQTETEFGVTGQATREQMVTMLYRFARETGADVSKFGNISDFSDSDQISPASKAAVAWAIAHQLISGKENNRFDPQGSASRAEVVSVIMRFLEMKAQP